VCSDTVGMAHLDIRPANILLAPQPSCETSTMCNTDTSVKDPSPIVKDVTPGQGKVASSFSLFASIQKTMETPREGTASTHAAGAY
jgi:hypothetical protein